MASVTEIILDMVKDEAVALSKIANAMMCSRPESYRRFRELNSCDTRIIDRESKSSDNANDRKKLFGMLSKLKKEGFISKRGNGTNSFWSITNDGLRKLSSFKNREKDLRSYLEYIKEETDKLIIVAFDIPERLRFHRAWLRDALKFLGFNMIQKSVWMGNIKIPEEFISDLRRKGVLEYVDIFEAGNRGTLQSLK